MGRMVQLGELQTPVVPDWMMTPPITAPPPVEDFGAWLPWILLGAAGLWAMSAERKSSGHEHAARELAWYAGELKKGRRRRRRR